MNPDDIEEVFTIAERLGFQIASQLLQALQDTQGIIKTKHTYAIGFAVGAAYRTIIGDRAQGAENEVADVLAEAFMQGWNLDELVKAIHARMTEEFGPKPWSAPAVWAYPIKD